MVPAKGVRTHRLRRELYSAIGAWYEERDTAYLVRPRIGLFTKRLRIDTKGRETSTQPDQGNVIPSAVAHGKKAELEIPDRSREGAEKITAQQLRSQWSFMYRMSERYSGSWKLHAPGQVPLPRAETADCPLTKAPCQQKGVSGNGKASRQAAISSSNSLAFTMSMDAASDFERTADAPAASASLSMTGLLWAE